jgi:hypothetical protein
MFLLKRLFNRREQEEPASVYTRIDAKPVPSELPIEAPAGPIWSVAANIRSEIPSGPGGKATRNGTRKFHGGAKVYVVNVYWGTGGENVMVIGPYRGKRFISCVVRNVYLENFRVELVYSPGTIKRIATMMYHHPPDGSEKSKQEAEKLAENLSKIQERLMEEKAQKRAKQDPSD